ncbi:ribonuclease P protein subunit p40 [Tachysurus fulvidraco]|uniref:ribonuclease P protein subunit p40 n=1 Tax=Tachysurus fulvidraco TaxID=1234273 RepID=UPI001FEF6F07|nr:ribonuclease P protein subunit p40 [Tachysurus fulvidraco]
MPADLEKCPRSLLVCEKSNFLNEASRHEAHVSKHSFNYKVSLLIPECGVLPADIAKVISKFSSYYLVRDLPVYRFLEEDMLKIIKKGTFYSLSYKTRLDEDNIIALSSRKLILSLDKDTYEQLGLEGKPSLYNHRKPMRFVVTVDLTDISLVPGTKRYQQVLMSLKERVPLRSDFLLTDCRSDQDGHLKALLSQYTYENCRPTLSSHSLTDVLCPSLQSSDLQGKSLSCSPELFLEWLGAANLNISCENSATSFLSTYTCPEPRSSVSQALICTVTGLIPPEDISVLLQELRRYFDAPKFTAWVSLTVHGFVDSPVSWGTTEHGFLKGGDNFYNFVCFKNQDYWLHMATGAHDGCPP